MIESELCPETQRPVSRDSLFPPHFDGQRFFNPGAPQAKGLSNVLRWKLTSRTQPSPRFVDDVTPARPSQAVDDGLRVTMINHSTVLLQMRGWNVLTDPIWSERASPFSWIGPRRRRAPGVALEDLPRIDVVLLSHNHYDHLDLATLRRLATRGGARFVVPLGVAALLRANRIGPVDELDWGEAALDGRIHAVPAMHFSARGLFDRNRTLWCGYWLDGIYFAGDTGFGEHFEWIRRQFGSPRLALLPIGAYRPEWFMAPVHMGPEEARRAHEILGARTSIAIHHGTFQLADESIDTPRRELHPDESFLALRNGESTLLK